MNKSRNLTLIFITAACILLSFLPFSDVWLYPIKLFVTYVHEMCHALAAILTGGSVHGIKINPDMSGTTTTSGGIFWIISFAGYLGTVLVGLMSIHLIRREVHPAVVLAIFLAFTFISMFFTKFDSMFGFVWGMILSGCILLMFGYASKFALEIFATFISIQLLLNAFYDLKTLFSLSVGSGVTTDALNMQHETGIPAVLWAILWITISVYTTYKVLFRKP